MNGPQHGPAAACRSLTVGETLTLSGFTGHYVNASNPKDHGNASAALSLSVAQTYVQGCVLSITGGSVTIGTTSHTITGGTILLNHDGRSGQGWGTTSDGSFLMRITGLKGNSTSASAGGVQFDLKAGTSEFIVHLNHH